MPVLVEANPYVFGALAFGMPHPGTLSFFEERLHQTSQHLTETGREFMAKGVDIFNKYGGAQALQYTKAAIRAVQHAFDSDVIGFLPDIGSIQQAPISMQRWIMAEPTVRQLFHDQKIDGYSESYVDVHPKDIAEQHYDWRAVMNGVIVETPDDPDYEWSCTNYFDDRTDDVKLTFPEKVDILNTWDLVKSLLQSSSREDPTSRYADRF